MTGPDKIEADLLRNRTSRLGRYVVGPRIGGGGMATVSVGRLQGPLGFSRPVAVKRLHPLFAEDPKFVAMMLDEARICGQILHPNVVPVLDLVAEQGEVAVILEYVHGLSLREVLTDPLPLPIACSIACDVLYGLHAAHEAVSSEGKRLGVVHRDVSPHNVLIGADGIARIGDFGIAKAMWRLQGTVDGQLKGKLSYMAPEQLDGDEVDRRTDLYSFGIVLWEMLTGQRLFDSPAVSDVVARVKESVRPPSDVVAAASAFDSVLARALVRKPSRRFETAAQMAEALESIMRPASRRQVADWLMSVGAEPLGRRSSALASLQSEPTEVESAAVPGYATSPDEATFAGQPGLEESPSPPMSTAKGARARKSQRGRIGLVATLAIVLALVIVAWRQQAATVPAAGAAVIATASLSPSIHSVSEATPEAPTAPIESTVLAPRSLDPNVLVAASRSAEKPSARRVVAMPTAKPVRSLTPRDPSVGPSIPGGRRTDAPHTAPSIGALAPAKSAHAACDPPFTIDDTGVKMYKPECL